MKYRISALMVVVITLLSWRHECTYWLHKDCKLFTLIYTTGDESSIDAYQAIIRIGIKNVEKFFDCRYKNKFDVVIYPNRNSLDSAWGHDWKTPGFKSECWMVASGVAKRIDILSPKTWDAESCEHKYGETDKTQQLITHELVHVFHGQLNVSPGFSDVKNIDWLIEGLATYASGQCDSNRIIEVIKALDSGAIPATIDQFWAGKLKYALSGTVAMYLDKKYGRIKMTQLLTYNDKEEILKALGVTEAGLLSGWKKYMLSLATR